MKPLPGLRLFAAFAAGSLLVGVSVSARANVYATCIKLNGLYTNVIAPEGDYVFVDYVLNEPATIGVTINILSGTNSIRSIVLPGGTYGTWQGSSTVYWDGLDDYFDPVPLGTYSVSVTAAAAGFTNWTQTSENTNPGNYVFLPTGLAVDQNPSSIYYGRVFVASSKRNPLGTVNVGDNVGILKLNADASPAEESPDYWLATGGHNWLGEDYSPWKLGVSADDHVYVMDEESVPSGLIFGWDPTISPSNRTAVLQVKNLGHGAAEAPIGLALFGSGSNSQLWIADDTSYQQGGLGIVRYQLTNDVCALSDTGVSVVGAAGVDDAPWDLAVDTNQNIYVLQSVDEPGSPPVLCFPAFNPATNHGAPELTPMWSIGENDESLYNAWGIAVDPTGRFLAVAVAGAYNGLVRVLTTTNGATVANLDMDTNAPSTHEDTACAWDAVGNLYIAKYYDNLTAKGLVAPGLWLEVSPPGANQATTMGTETIQVTIMPPEITQLSVSNSEVFITFAGSIVDYPLKFSLQSASSPMGSFTTVPAGSVTQLSPGDFVFAVPASGPAQFYRILK